MADLKNNLFYYATKELSQDAFICWLCSYALEDADITDKELVKCAHNLVCEFLERGIEKDIDHDKAILKEVKRQIDNIDVLLTVEYIGKIYKIIVEDKVHSSEHDDQLRRYKEKLSEDNYDVIGIYFKTGFQSNMAEVNKAGYKLFNRNDILSLLEKCNSNNDILKAYRDYWNDFENLAKSYRIIPVSEWPDWQPVNGFYDEMQSILEENGCWAGYGYVSNPAGGFWGLWYGMDEIFKIDSFEAELYLQVESSWNYDLSKYDNRICLKLKNRMEDKRDDRIWKLRDILIEKQSDYGFEKPARFRSGQHMTIGIYNAQFNDYKEFVKVILASVEQLKGLFRVSNSEMNVQ